MRRALLSFLLLFPLWAPGFAQAPTTVAQEHDWAAFLGPFPKVDSDEGKADLAIVLWHQRTRTPAEVQSAAAEVKLLLGAYSEAMGQPLDAVRFPKTAALLDQVGKDIKAQTDGLKKLFGRPRPYLADARVQPAIERETSPSYPSGHATRGIAFAMVLSELVPSRRETLLACGRQVGVHRVIGGVHYPSDIEAGQRLGLKLGELWLANPLNRAQVDGVRTAEWYGPKP
jgi:membrane-associated phospholipid phosphatase